jgi:phospholipase D1/2
MGSSRTVLLDIVRKADRYGRFGMYFPVTEGGTPIYVHAKVLVADDRFLRVGSSNLNNRSMGYDTECDISVEVSDAATRDRIVTLRDDLLAEHLGVTPGTIARTIAAHGGSLIQTIEVLRGEGRSLRPMETLDLNAVRGGLLAENTVLDPERAEQISLGRFLPEIWPRAKGKRGSLTEEPAG